MVEVDFGEVGADVVGVAGVDMLPGLFHAGNLGRIVKVTKESVFEFFRRGTGNHAGNVHIRIAGAGKAKINHTDDLVVFV